MSQPRGLRSLKIKNFAILGAVEVSLGRLNVLVGPNGSGKSTLLDVVGFLGDAARSQLADAVESRGGFGRLRTRGTLDPVTIHVQAVVTAHAREQALDEYTLTFRPIRVRTSSGSETAAVRQSEQFRFKRVGGRGRRITLSGGKLSIRGDTGKARQLTLDQEAFGLAVLPHLGKEEGAAEVRKVQELFTTFRVFDVDAEAARRPADVRDASRLRNDASNLAAFLGFLASDHPGPFAALVDDARAVVPGLADVRLRTVGGAGEALAVDVADRGMPGVTPLADASFGTVRALALLAMLYDPNPPLLTCVEEIDHGLHPHVFDRLVDRLREASARTQFLIATHSPALVNRLRTSELIVCERSEETGLARIPAIDPDDVEEVMDGNPYGLGEVWFSGTLGGVPK